MSGFQQPAGKTLNAARRDQRTQAVFQQAADKTLNATRQGQRTIAVFSNLLTKLWMPQGRASGHERFSATC